MGWGVRTLVSRGGGLGVNIPSKIKEHLGLKEGDQLIFLFDEDKKFAIIGTKSMIKLDKEMKKMLPGALGLFDSDMDEKDIDLILQELAKKEEEK